MPVDEIDLARIMADVDAPRTSDDALGVNRLDRVPYEIACQHARMAACAMVTGEMDKAIRAVVRAFEIAREESQAVVTRDSHVSCVASQRTANVLESYDVVWIADLVSLTAEDLLAMNGINTRSVARIEESLKRYGLSLSK